MTLVEGNVWASQNNGPSIDPRPALFLDRDGTIIEERNYLSRPEDVVLIPGSAAVLKTYASSGWHIVVVTNQSGIGRGYFAWEDYARVEARLGYLLAVHGVQIGLTLACGHIAGGVPPYGEDHAWRKPNPGMFAEARERLNIDMAASVAVGDKLSDIMAARSAGVGRTILVLTGHGSEEARKLARHPDPGVDAAICQSLGEIPPPSVFSNLQCESSS